MKKQGSHDRMLLTPKNVYRCLTYRLHPGRQNNIFPNNLPGLTLIRFWKAILTPVLPEQLLNSLFDTENKRSRRLSDLMNRTGPWSMTKEVEQALVSTLNPTTFAELVLTFETFLKNNHYIGSVFVQEMAQFVERCCKDDRAIDESSCRFLRGLFNNSVRQNDDIPQTFRDGYGLAWVALFSLFGTDIGNPELLALRGLAASSCRYLWKREVQDSIEKHATTVITTRTSLLCRRPLPEEQFVGRENEYEALIQAVLIEGKVLVSGMGGIGKTELVRQAVRHFERHAEFSSIAYVQYEGSLAASYRLAFPSLTDEDDESVVRLVRHQLENSGGKELLLIDNIDLNEGDDPYTADLETYGCHVIVTSRSQTLNGFVDIHLLPLSIEASCRLFDFHSGLSLNENEQGLLTMADGHPIAVALMGKLCRLRHCSPAELKHMLEEQGFSSITLTRNTPAKKLQEMLNGLYREKALDESMGRLLALFSTFPVMLWPIECLRPVLADLGHAQLVDELLAEAANNGWLEEDQAGYFMHPVIAEVFRQKAGSWRDYPILSQWIDKYGRSDLKLVSRTDTLRTLLCAGPLCYLQPDEHNRAFFLPMILQISSRLPDGYRTITQRLLSLAEKLNMKFPSDDIRFWLLCCQIYQAELDNKAQLAQTYGRKAIELASSVEITPMMMRDIRTAIVSANNLGLVDEAEQLLLRTLDHAPKCPQLIILLLAAAEHYIIHGRQMECVEAYTAQARELLEAFGLTGTLYETDLMLQETKRCYVNRDVEHGLLVCAETIERYTAYLGTDDHPIIAELCRMGASFCMWHNEMDRAQAYFEQAHRIMDPERRGENVAVALIECSYATLCRKKGDSLRAYELSRKGMNSLLHIQGRTMNTAAAMRIHGEACEAVGKTDEAVSVMRKCVELWTESAGADFLETARAEVILGRGLLLRRRYAEAKRRISHAIEVLKNQLGEETNEMKEARELQNKILAGKK